MLTDSYGQSIPYLDETDSPDLNVWGSALVGALTGRLVMRFASTSARDATITTPVAGMRCYISATDTYMSYTSGAGWVPDVVGANVPWTPLASLLNAAGGVTDNGNSEGATGYRVVSSWGQQRLEFQGGVNLATDPGSTSITMFTLPVAARPSSRRSAPVAKTMDHGIGTTKVDINADGTCNVFGTQGAGSATTWVSLNGVAVYL